MKTKRIENVYQGIYEKFEDPLNKVYIDALSFLYEKSEKEMGKKLLEQYSELIDTGIERIEEKEWETHAEKRMNYLRLQEITDVEEMYEFVQDLEEDDEIHYHSHYHSHFYHEDESDEYRRKVEDTCLDFISTHVVEEILKRIHQSYSRFVKYLKVTDKDISSFLEYTFDDHYDWLTNEVEGFDNLHFSLSFSFNEFDGFSQAHVKTKNKIQRALKQLENELKDYHEELEQITKELTADTKLKQLFVQQIQQAIADDAFTKSQQAIELIEKRSKTPKDTQQLLSFMEEYAKKEWTIDDLDSILSFLKHSFLNKSYVQDIYGEFMETRNALHEFDEEEYEMLTNEIISKDILGLQRIIEDEKEKYVKEFQPLTDPVKNIVREVEKLKIREEKWIKDVLGPSVFETYKKNNPQKIVIHVGLTNTGKTYNALQRLKNADIGLYLAPLRLLALEIYERLNNEGTSCSLKTGEEEKITEGATHLSSTVEMCPLNKKYDCVVIDECQMVGDKERGNAWVRAILGVDTNELHLITAPEGLPILKKILDEKEYEVITHQRDTELSILSKRSSLKQVQKGDAIIVFSRLQVLKVSKQLENKGFKPAIIYGSMPPSVRQKQVEYFHKGEFDVVVATDAIGMGMNLPVQRVLFMETSKFDGTKRRFLKPSEFRQIGGRAGRKGMFEVGYVGFMEQEHQAKNTMLQTPQDIEKVVISPTFEMFERFVDALEFECGIRALRTFIHYWRTYKPTETFVRIHQMNQQITLLGYLKQYETKKLISLEQLWSFIHVPVDHQNGSLVDVWKKNIKAIIIDHSSYELELKQIEKLNQLEDLELAYKKIDTHLAFCEDGDVQFRYYEGLKEQISEKIFSILTKRIQTLTKKCKHCKNRLPLTYEHAMCQSCYQKKYQKRYRDYEEDDDFYY